MSADFELFRNETAQTLQCVSDPSELERVLSEKLDALRNPVNPLSKTMERVQEPGYEEKVKSTTLRFATLPSCCLTLFEPVGRVCALFSMDYVRG